MVGGNLGAGVKAGAGRMRLGPPGPCQDVARRVGAAPPSSAQRIISAVAGGSRRVAFTSPRAASCGRGCEEPSVDGCGMAFCSSCRVTVVALDRSNEIIGSQGSDCGAWACGAAESGVKSPSCEGRNRLRAPRRWPENEASCVLRAGGEQGHVRRRGGQGHAGEFKPGDDAGVAVQSPSRHELPDLAPNTSSSKWRQLRGAHGSRGTLAPADRACRQASRRRGRR